MLEPEVALGSGVELVRRLRRCGAAGAAPEPPGVRGARHQEGAAGRLGLSLSALSPVLASGTGGRRRVQVRLPVLLQTPRQSGDEDNYFHTN